MQGERPKRAEVPEVPGALQLAWLLFMKPITLHKMLKAWGIEPGGSWFGMRRQAKDDGPIPEQLLRSALALVWGVLPLS